MRRPSKSFEIALSAIACAVAAAALTVGSYVDVLLPSGYLIAIFALMVPLSKNFVWGAFLAYVGACLLAFFFCGFAIFQILPFIAFFGLHPVVNWLQKKFIRKKPLHVPFFIVKAVWFDLSMWLAWAVVFVPIFGLNAEPWYPYIEPYFFLILFLGGTVFFAAYDYLIFLSQRSINAIVRRIRR